MYLPITRNYEIKKEYFQYFKTYYRQENTVARENSLTVFLSNENFFSNESFIELLPWSFYKKYVQF